MTDVLPKDDILKDVEFDDEDDDDVPELVSVAQNLTLEPPTPLAAANNDTAANDMKMPLLAATTATRPTSSIPFKPCPVTILSGFLGSGKTTLIQHLLQSPDHGKRIAVIENEYGDGSLDTTTTTAAAAATTLSSSSSSTTAKDGLQRSIESLIAQDSSKQNNNSLSDWIELPNGCLCCTVKDKLVTTLEHLITIKGDELDCILIEMSGMALPGPLASLFWLDDDVENDTMTPTTTTSSNTAFDTSPSTSSIHSRLRLDGIITVVDAYHVDSQLQTTFEAACQIAQADRILVNKIDLLPSTATGAVDDILSTLRQINPTALVQTTSYGRVPDWNWIFDIHSLDMDHRTLQHVEEVWSHQTNDDVDHDTVCTDANCQESHDHSHEHHNDHHHHHEDEHARIPKKLQKQQQQQHAHTSGVSTITLSHRGSVDLAQLNTWVASILWPHQDEAEKVLRARLEQSLLPRQEPSLSTDLDNDVATTPATPKSHDKQDDSTTPQIFRIKGILSVRKPLTHLDEEEDLQWIDPLTGLDRRYYILQAVHDLWEIHPSQNEQFLWNDGDDDDRCCKLIVIGRYMDAPSLRASFEECAV